MPLPARRLAYDRVEHLLGPRAAGAGRTAPVRDGLADPLGDPQVQRARRVVRHAPQLLPGKLGEVRVVLVVEPPLVLV